MVGSVKLGMFGFMNFLRSVVCVVIGIIVLIPCAITVLLWSVFARGDTLYYGVAKPFLSAMIWLAEHIGGVKYRVMGAEHLPAKGDNQPIILCPKHQSTWETFALPTIMRQPLSYVFKRELLAIPFFGWALARLDMVHIDRSNRTEAWNKVAAQGRELMNTGHWVIMFPEGTRTERGKQGVYKSGASRLAVLTGASIVPIAVTSARCWPRRSFALIPGTIDVSIGAPISSQGKEPAQMMREVEQWIEAEMRRLDPQAYPETQSQTQVTEET